MKFVLVEKLGLGLRAAALMLGGVGLLVASGCGSCGKENSAAAEESEAPLRTADGVEIISAPRREGPAPSRPGDSNEQRLIREPTSPDPDGGEFTLEEAVVDLGNDGTLVAEIRTDFGTIMCDLFADDVPKTVANFIGLARGRRHWWDARAGLWVTTPYYSRSTFHRVMPGYMIQGGDYLGDGSGGVGYTIPDEANENHRSHDRAGLLCMANVDERANSAGGQFFITDAPATQLDEGGKYTIFGECVQKDLVSQIARVPQRAEEGNRPITEVQIIRVVIRRVRGGAPEARRLLPALPEGVNPDNPLEHRGASPGPAELREYPGHAPSEPTLPPQLEPFRPPGHGHDHSGHGSDDGHR